MGTLLQKLLRFRLCLEKMHVSELSVALNPPTWHIARRLGGVACRSLDTSCLCYDWCTPARLAIWVVFASLPSCTCSGTHCFLRWLGWHACRASVPVVGIGRVFWQGVSVAQHAAVLYLKGLPIESCTSPCSMRYSAFLGFPRGNDSLLVGLSWDHGLFSPIWVDRNCLLLFFWYCFLSSIGTGNGRVSCACGSTAFF